jgi:hypothetical protein
MDCIRQELRHTVKWRQKLRTVIGLCLLALWSAPAWASPTGLNTIPTPDLVPLHQYNTVVQNTNSSLDSGPMVFRQPVFLPQFQSGITDSTEQNSIVASLLYGNHEQQINGLLANFTRTANW